MMHARMVAGATGAVLMVLGVTAIAGDGFEPGTLVWHLGTDQTIETRFTPDRPIPLRQVEADWSTYHLDPTGHIERVEAPPPMDPQNRATLQATPSGTIELRQGSIALLDPESGATHWQLTHESPVNLQYGLELDRLPMIAYSAEEQFLVLWRCTLDGTALPADAVFVVEVETGAYHRVPLIGAIGDRCHVIRGGFIVELRMDRLSRKQTLVCHASTGKRRWWRTVDDGRVTLVQASAGDTPRELLVIMHQMAETKRCRPFVLDAATGKEILRHELGESTRCVGTMGAAGNLLGIAGREFDAARPCARAGVIDVAGDAPRWFRTFHCIDDSVEVMDGRFKVGPLAVGATTGVMAITVQFTEPGNVHHCELWLFDAAGETLARVPVPGVGFMTQVQELELVDDERYVLVRHVNQPSLFAIR